MGYVSKIAELYPLQGEWVEEDYFSLPDTNRFMELSEGRLIMPPHPTFRHQMIVQKLFLKFNNFVEANHLGMVCLAPLPVRLWPGKIREPDILFIAKEHYNRIKEEFCEVPDLVVEVTSPGTKQTDRREKKKEYAQAGVKEFWLVDSEKGIIEVYVLKNKGYQLAGRYGADNVATSSFLSGLAIKVEEILFRL